jgi:hypothetical protein
LDTNLARLNQPSKQIAFELHITVAPLLATQLDDFLGVCELLNAKPLLIELARGEMQLQPMLNKIMFAQCLHDAIAAAQILAHELLLLDFPSVRQKLEIATIDLPLLSDFADVVYFEWHARLPFQDVPALLALCEQHQAHLSRNALANTTSTMRFVTLRRSDWQDFCVATAALRQRLTGRWPIQKEISEACLFDSNLNLDQGWLYASANHRSHK